MEVESYSICSFETNFKRKTNLFQLEDNYNIVIGFLCHTLT